MAIILQKKIDYWLNFFGFENVWVQKVQSKVNLVSNFCESSWNRDDMNRLYEWYHVTTQILISHIPRPIIFFLRISSPKMPKYWSRGQSTIDIDTTTWKLSSKNQEDVKFFSQVHIK